MEKVTLKSQQGNSEIVNQYFLPKKAPDAKKYTLVLDLDETLIHYVEEENNAFIQIRPYAEEFLEEMSNYYELVIFTAAMKDVICFT